MATAPQPSPSFSPRRKWSIGLNVLLIIVIVLSVVVMVNYLSRDYFVRFHLSTRSKKSLSPRTVKLLQSITNHVEITIYYDKEEPIYSTIADLLNEYKFVNPKLTLRTVDYQRDAGAAQQLLAKYPFLASSTAKNLIIFDCDGKVKTVDGNALRQYVLEQMPNTKENEYRKKPTQFLGEMTFTAKLLDVTNPKPLKAFFLKGHGEHQVDSGDEVMGYLKFAAILQQNYISVESLSLLGTNLVPSDCNLLVIAGPTGAIPEIELGKIEQYLGQGGRMLVMFSYQSINKETGLEKILSKWGVGIGNKVIRDPENTTTSALTDVIVGNFGKHPIVNPLLKSYIQLVQPRSVGKLDSAVTAADAPRVEEVAFSGPKSFAADGPLRDQHVFPLIVAVEKGAIKGVVTERGMTRMVITGDADFLDNQMIPSLANRDFAGFAVNWLLDRTQLLEGLGPRPIIEYGSVMTKSQLQSVQIILLAGMPGAVLLFGGMVWLRRRR
ncbi:MAG: gliding motility-associatede transport system auxiliary component [Verrucomicrobiota bacterium]